MTKSAMESVSVLFVCLGNICRSPSSEGVFLNRLEFADLPIDVRVDSAGTGSYHIGQPPDHRAILAASERGVDISWCRARQVVNEDFEKFDYIIAMDRYNYRDLTRMAPSAFSGQLCLLMDFAANSNESEVPDPYYGSDGGFERVLDMLEDACSGLIDDIRLRCSRQ